MAECEYCTSPATWTLNVQWSVVDFLDVSVCGEDLAPAMAHWQRRTVEGLSAVISYVQLDPNPLGENAEHYGPWDDEEAN